ncbi:MAG: CAP domain-containing protein [Flavimaricola sp.]|nr:CAP domain-containing protein [Flavimaricola sp.]
MRRRNFVIALSLAGLAACAGPRASIGPDGLPEQQIYRISEQDSQEIPFRALDGLNTLRQAAGVRALVLDAQLTAAAATHSRDMAIQNRPWHFGSDGSSPIDRIQRVGYQGNLVGETISETFETETETLAAWVQLPQTREVLLDPTATRMGISWFQEPGGKIWWTLVLGN